MLKKVIILVALLVSATLAKEISFDELAKIVDASSPKMEQQRVNTNISKVKLEIAQSQYYPTLSIGASTEYSLKYNQSFTPSSIGSSSLTQISQYQASTVLGMNYDLYRFGATSLHVKAAQKEIDSYIANECIVSEQLLIELLETYQRARIANIKLNYYMLIKKSYEELYVNAKRLYKYGSLKQTDVSSYALQIADLVFDTAQTREEKNSALAHLCYLSGVKIDNLHQLTPLHVDDSYISIPEFEQSSKAKKMQAQIAQKSAQLKAEQKSYYPTLALYGKYDLYGSDKEKFFNAFDNIRKNGYRVGLSLSFNIFDGFKREANIKIRLLELQSAKIALKDSKREYEKQRNLLNTLLKTRENRLNSSKEGSKVSNTLLLMSNKLHVNGESDRLGELKSQITLYQNLLKTDEAKEMLLTSKMKKIIISQKENECAVH